MLMVMMMMSMLSRLGWLDHVGGMLGKLIDRHHLLLLLLRGGRLFRCGHDGRGRRAG